MIKKGIKFLSINWLEMDQRSCTSGENNKVIKQSGKWYIRVSNLSLSMLALSSRDQHEKMATKLYVPQNTPYIKLYLGKAD